MLEPSTRLRHPSAGETSLFLVRHGRTSGNRRRLLQGVKDVPLDAVGRDQARRVAARLASEPVVDAIISSPLRRARTTASIIGRELGLTPAIAPNLIEMDFGQYEGTRFETMAIERPDLAERFLNIEDYEVAWPGGEARGNFYTRVSRAFEEILRQYESHRIVVVAHGGVFGAFLAMLEGRSPNDLTVYDLENCGVTHLHVGPNHTVLHYRNDVAHLDAREYAETVGGGG